MTAILELPAVRQHCRPLSVEEYHRLGDGLRAELLRGCLIEKKPKSPLHRRIVRELFRLLSEAVGTRFEIYKEDPLTLGDSEPEPDLAVVPLSPDGYRDEHPHMAQLVIEVSVSSVELDRVKALIYAEAGVPEYWIVLPEEKCIEVYREPAASGYGSVQRVSTGVLSPASIPEVSVSLEGLFA